MIWPLAGTLIAGEKTPMGGESLSDLSTCLAIPGGPAVESPAGRRRGACPGGRPGTDQAARDLQLAHGRPLDALGGKRGGLLRAERPRRRARAAAWQPARPGRADGGRDRPGPEYG